jgi:acetyl-CoA acyltransferase
MKRKRETVNQAIFTGGLRTPFGRAFKGAYKDVRADDLLIEILNAQKVKHGAFWDHGPGDLVVGTAYPEHEQGYNVARMAALGCDLDVPGTTVNRLCASSMEAIAMAASRINAGWGELYLTAGIESMSRIPRRGANFSESATIKTVNPLAYTPNGDTAELVADKHPDLTREKQEDFAAQSHTTAFKAHESGKYANQIHPFLIQRDEFIRVPVDREKMASLKPAFKETGSVTAATSSPLTDGATSGWVVEAGLAKQLGVTHGLKIIDAQVAHVPPEVMGMGPVPATQMIFARNQLSPTDVAAFEINEAFAIQVLASIKELKIPADRVNNWGGAIALGHPLGSSGLRLVMTLHDRLAELGEVGAYGISTLCVGGGQGMSILFQWTEI